MKETEDQRSPHPTGQDLSTEARNKSPKHACAKAPALHLGTALPFSRRSVSSPCLSANSLPSTSQVSLPQPALLLLAPTSSDRELGTPGAFSPILLPSYQVMKGESTCATDKTSQGVTNHIPCLEEGWSSHHILPACPVYPTVEKGTDTEPRTRDQLPSLSRHKQDGFLCTGWFLSLSGTLLTLWGA